MKHVAAKFEGPYLFGAHPTVADYYLFVMLLWAAKFQLAVPDNLAAFSARMRERPAVKRALTHEGLA